jgi:Ethanolamine utilization protein EutJ (predicted chaperonin)
MSNYLYVGVDLGLNNFVVCPVDDQGKQVSGKATFSNDLVGAERFVNKLLA